MTRDHTKNLVRKIRRILKIFKSDFIVWEIRNKENIYLYKNNSFVKADPDKLCND